MTRIITPPLIGETQPPEYVAYDEIALREPRLLVPGMQPLGKVKADMLHPLSRDLVEFISVDDGGPYSVLTGARGILGGTPGEIVPYSAGRGYNTQAASDATNYVDVPMRRLTAPLTGITIAVHGVVASTTPISSSTTSVAGLRAIMACHINSTPSGAGIGVPADETTLQVVGAVTASRAINPAGSITINVPFVAFCWYDNATTTWKAQVNNGTVAENASTTSFASVTPVNPVCVTGYKSSTSAPGNRTLFGGMVFNRELTATEREGLVADFYQMLIPA